MVRLFIRIASILLAARPSGRRRSPPRRLPPRALVLGTVALLVIGCSRQAIVEPTAGVPGYTGALDTTYENALDVISQLALGTLNLEGTELAVTEDQAARLLPLWQALGAGTTGVGTTQGSVFQSDAERSAVVRQIERTMTEAQVSAIVAMQLTQQDVQAWIARSGDPARADSQGGRVDQLTAPEGSQTQGGRQGPGGAPPGMAVRPSEEQIAQLREQFQNMSPAERATRQAQFGGQGGGQGFAGRPRSSAAGGISAGLARAVIALLVERSGQTVAEAGPERSEGSALAATPTPTTNFEATPTSGEDLDRQSRSASPTPAAPTATAEPTPVPEATPTAIDVRIEATPAVEPTPTTNFTATPPTLPRSHTPTPAPAATLARIEDTNPGPPFAIEVRANMTTQDPLVAASRTYKIMGLVRNDGNQTYAVSAIHVTFYDAQGFRGTFAPAIRDGRLVGGEWHWHGQTEADLACLLLAPGEEWPFSIQITAQDMASFLIHPDAAPTERVSAPLALSDVRLTDEASHPAGTGYVRISGTATNGNPFQVKNVTVSGVLLDANGQMVSVGSQYVLEQDIEPGESVHFDVRVPKEPYARYQLYAQAEQDWQ